MKKQFIGEGSGLREVNLVKEVWCRMGEKRKQYFWSSVNVLTTEQAGANRNTAIAPSVETSQAWKAGRNTNAALGWLIITHQSSSISCSVMSDCDPMDCTAHQAPPSVGFSRQEYWNGLPFPSPEDPNPGIKARSPELQAGYLPSEPPGEAPYPSIQASGSMEKFQMNET